MCCGTEGGKGECPECDACPEWVRKSRRARLLFIWGVIKLPCSQSPLSSSSCRPYLTSLELRPSAKARNGGMMVSVAGVSCASRGFSAMPFLLLTFWQRGFPFYYSSGGSASRNRNHAYAADISNLTNYMWIWFRLCEGVPKIRTAQCGTEV